MTANVTFLKKILRMKQLVLMVGLGKLRLPQSEIATARPDVSEAGQARRIRGGLDRPRGDSLARVAHCC
ncbi:putative cP4-57 prophage [Paraburkholderia fungorum]|uniref:CP4-57 prophage n=1 Tax=Paraburkholderia fungorum TaxID=134537 RepID=A0AAU8T0F3_9BURK|nr:hypothetical protein [Paraburkholderia fungorum]AJZ59698.1 putative cP4-57 prophage [Paraburkholderia fungorum]